MKHIEIIFEDVVLKGIIHKREKFRIEVQLTSPYKTWKNYALISGRCRTTPNHLLTDYGDDIIRQLLIVSYKKYKILNENFDRICKRYVDFKLELMVLDKLSDTDNRSIIKEKLEDWFFNKLFITSVTGLSATISDRKHIFELLEHHFKPIARENMWQDYNTWLQSVYPKLNNF